MNNISENDLELYNFFKENGTLLEEIAVYSYGDEILEVKQADGKLYSVEHRPDLLNYYYKIEEEI